MPDEVRAEHAFDKSFSAARVFARRAFVCKREFCSDLGFTSRFDASAKNSSHKEEMFPKQKERHLLKISLAMPGPTLPLLRGGVRRHKLARAARIVHASIELYLVDHVSDINTTSAHTARVRFGMCRTSPTRVWIRVS